MTKQTKKNEQNTPRVSTDVPVTPESAHYDPEEEGIYVWFPRLEAEISGYVSRRIDIHLTPKQAETAKRLAETLCRNGERLNKGTLVSTPQHAVQFLLEVVERCCDVSEDSEVSETA